MVKKFKVAAPVAAPGVVRVGQAAEKPVHVSLRYWHTGSQCISVWQRGELEKLRKLIDKVQKLTPTAIRTDAGLHWKNHNGPPRGKGWSSPAGLSKDVPICELRVDNKARVHGAIYEGTFYLVWLDRNHEVFPAKK